MHCPSCHAENAAEADACSACGAPLRRDSAVPSKAARRSGSRRRVQTDQGDASATENDHDPSARRAYRVSLLALVPGLGLILGPIAVILGCLAVRRAVRDAASRNRAKVAILFGVLITLSQWIGMVLMIRSWPP